MNFVGKIVMCRFIVGRGAAVVSAFSCCLFILAFVNGMMYGVEALFGFRVVVGRSLVLEFESLFCIECVVTYWIYLILIIF